MKTQEKNIINIKVGIIGLGSIAKKHIRYLKKQKNFIVEIYYLNLNRSDQSKIYLRNNFKKTFKDLNLIKKNFFDLIFICTPSSNHINDYINLNKYCSNFFIEKPLCLNKDCHKRIEEYKNFYIGYVLNHKKIINKAREIINSKDKKILNVEILCKSYLPSWRTNENYKLGHTYNSDLSGGILYELSHEFEYAYNLFGNYNIYKYDYKTSNKIGSIIDNFKIVTRSKKKDFLINFDLSISSKKIERNCKIYLKNEIINIDLYKNKIFIVDRSNNKQLLYSYKDDDMYETQINYLLNKISNSKSIFETNNFKSSRFTNNFLSKIIENR